MRKTLLAALGALVMTTACVPASEEPVEPAPLVPVARWDHRPEAEIWTRAAMDALDGPGAPLVSLVPEDIDVWCPEYAELSDEGRKAFWVGLLSSLAKHESTWRPEVSGGGGKWFGLLQISPGTARGYGCEAQSASALKNGAANLRCAIRIMGRTVARDRVIAAGGRGVAADWGPFHQTRKRTEMAEWTRQQDYCQG